MDILPFVQAFVLLIVIMDPLLSMAAFLSMTKGLNKKERDLCAAKAVVVAAVPLFLFLLAGNVLLTIMKVDIETFKAAGGLILVLLGIQLSLGISFLKEENSEDMHDTSAIASVIGTPLITGPATISAAIILGNEFGIGVTAVAGIGALLVIWLVLMAGALMYKYLGRTGIRVLSTMMGLVTIAWGVAFIKAGFFGP
jgi:multiple antibiotic resistance protein